MSAEETRFREKFLHCSLAVAVGLREHLLAWRTARLAVCVLNEDEASRWCLETLAVGGFSGSRY